MKNTLQNESPYFSYDIGNMRGTPQQNIPVRRKVLKSREDFPRIEQKTLRQPKPINTKDVEKLDLRRKRLISNLNEKIQKQFYKILQDYNADFAQEFESLKHFYNFCEIESVKAFLRKNRFLVPLLREVPEKIYDYFGNDQKLSLKISFESDSPKFAELWVSILTELPANEALSILDRFDEEWWLENMDRTDSKLNITLKFV